MLNPGDSIKITIQDAGGNPYTSPFKVVEYDDGLLKVVERLEDGGEGKVMIYNMRSTKFLGVEVE